MRQILYGLFFQPQVLLALQQGKLGRPIRLLILFCVLGGALLGLVRFPAASEAAREWILWFGEVTQGVSYQHGRLDWQRPRDLPYTTRHRGWKVDFRGGDFSWPGELRTGPERRGLVFTPTTVLAWHEREEGLQVVPLLEDGRVMNMVGADTLWPDGLTLQPGDFDSFADELTRGQLLFLMFRHMASLLGATFFYTLLFAGIPALFRRSVIGGEGGFRRIFCFYCYAAIPPLFVAIVYGAVNPPFLRISEVFVLAMAAYLLLVFRSIRAFLPSPAE